ncbi:MAG TPA: hypothetical protein VJS64_07495 [Pyrinomonadaceae bacterium]|nr:hypothetical protein [Pyrinomonadaceae bacterium]
MQLLRFSFKNEAVWLMVFSLLPGVMGVLVLLIIKLIEVLR